MDCPNCHLLNPPTAMRCDCGYDFNDKTMRSTYDSNIVRENAIREGRQEINVGLALVGIGFVGGFYGFLWDGFTPAASPARETGR